MGCSSSAPTVDVERIEVREADHHHLVHHRHQRPPTLLHVGDLRRAWEDGKLKSGTSQLQVFSENTETWKDAEVYGQTTDGDMIVMYTKEPSIAPFRVNPKFREHEMRLV